MNQNKLRVGVIGAGAVVKEIYQHLYFKSAYSEMLEISAIATPSQERRNWFGDLAGLPAGRRFADYSEMIRSVELDVVQVNTPDDLHRPAVEEALRAGLDVIVPKPLASSVRDGHEMIQTAKSCRRFLGVDFHKREDPRLREAQARFRSGRYGKFQAGVFYMLDKLLVSDPNHAPRFFGSPDFAQKNTPISFLTVHMVDALMQVIGQVPREVRAIAHAHKLPALKPIPVQGYDLVDTEVIFEQGGAAHILTGWALPNSAWSTTVQSARILCSEGFFDLGLDTPGLREVTAEGMAEVNPLFRNFGPDGRVSGYGMDSPGRLYRQAWERRYGAMSGKQLDSALDPMTLGFYATLVLEGASRSLEAGRKTGEGSTIGKTINLRELMTAELGFDGAAQYPMG